MMKKAKEVHKQFWALTIGALKSIETGRALRSLSTLSNGGSVRLINPEISDFIDSIGREDSRWHALFTYSKLE